MDALVGDVCYKHMNATTESLEHWIEIGKGNETFDSLPYFIPTVSVDRVDFVSNIRLDRDLRMSAYMMAAKGSTMVVKIDCEQRPASGDYEKIGEAIFLFLARDKSKNQAYAVPSLKLSPSDDVLMGAQAYELGIMLKNFSIQKAQRDLHKQLPTFEESTQFQTYLQTFNEQAEAGEVSLHPISETVRRSS